MTRCGSWTLLLVMAFFAAGCIALPGENQPCLLGGDTGIGGTGIHAQSDPGTGIGGTGLHAKSESDPGFDSAELLAQTKGEIVGIRGHISGFGSILVNGAKVELPVATVITRRNSPVSIKELALGQVVEVLAVNNGSDFLAQEIHIRYEVIGPVEPGDGPAGGIRILGQLVHLSEGTVFDGGREVMTSPGARVRVSGLRDADGRILASRLEPTDPAEPDLLVGRVEAVGSGQMLVSGLPVGASGQVEALPAPNSIVCVRGRLTADGFIATDWQSEGRVPFAGRAGAVLIEAIPLPSGTAQTGRSLAGMPYVVDDRGGLLPQSESRPIRILARLGETGELRPAMSRVAPGLREVRPGGGASGRQKVPTMRRMPLSRSHRR